MSNSNDTVLLSSRNVAPVTLLIVTLYPVGIYESLIVYVPVYFPDTLSSSKVIVSGASANVPFSYSKLNLTPFCPFGTISISSNWPIYWALEKVDVNSAPSFNTAL